MERYKVHIINDNTYMEADQNTSLMELSKEYAGERSNRFLLAKVDNIERDLNYVIDNDCTVEFLDISSDFGYRTYQRSCAFIMLAAIAKVVGQDNAVWVEHTINNNYFCHIDGIDVTEDLLSDIKNKMQSIIRQNYTIEKLNVPVNEAIEMFEKYGLEHRKKALNYVKSLNVTVYKMNNYYDYLYGTMVPQTGYISTFDLHMHSDGFVLQFESRNEPGVVNEYKAYPKLTQIYAEYTNWSRILEVSSAGALNDLICHGRLKEIILISEALQEKKIAIIADEIFRNGKRIVLIAGPSSSGKTTFSNRLGIQLKVLGLSPSIISLDDYYRNREDIPVGEDGRQDFECLESLNVERFNDDILKLLKGEAVETPLYDFITGKSKPKGKLIKMDADSVLIIEGIHGINENLTHRIPKDDKYKIYISALTQLNIDEHSRISTTDTRLLRRIVRDNNFRGFSAKSTIDMWHKVLEGENKNIFPYQEQADAMFNSALIYELGVLKTYAEPLLFSIEPSESGYMEAKRLLNFLNSFLNIPAVNIPPNSLIREFIGGSCFNV